MNPRARYRRNSLRLEGWDYSLPGPYFFTTCAAKRRAILSRESIRKNAVEGFKELSAELEVAVHAIVVAVDHVHGLASLPEGGKISLPQYVGSAKVRLTQMIREEGGQAHPYAAIWQRSYYDHIIRGQQDFEEKARHLENHPLKEEGKVLVQWH